MNDSVLVNQVYLIFNRPQFLVDSNDRILIVNFIGFISVITDDLNVFE